MKRSLTTLALLAFMAVRSLYGQSQFFACPTNPPNPGASTCREACISCDLEGITDINNVPIPVPLPIANCAVGGPPFVMENPRWYGFIANSTFLVLSIKLGDCQLGTGLEGAIFNACSQQLPGALTCASGGNPLFLSVDNLVVGNRYFLAIDGVGGDVCDYTISVISGSTVAPQLGAIGNINGLNQVCPKAKVTYTVPAVQNALAYTWTSPLGSKINGGANTRTVAAPGGTSVEVEFGASSGIVCVSAINVCDTPVTSCMAVINQALAITDLPEKTVCYEELPYYWEEAPGTLVGAPGTYTLISSPYPSYLGCDSMVRQTIIALPRKQKTLPPRWLCEGECFTINGEDFCETGTYQEILTTDEGCDSTVNFTLIKILVHAGAKPADTITCKTPSVPLSADNTITVGNGVSYRWTDSNGVTISNSTTATASAPGAYYFIVTNSGGGVSCRDTAEVIVPANLTPPVAHSGPGMVLTCQQPQVQLQGTGSTGSQFSYQWTALINGNIVSGANTLTPTVNAPGSYLLVVTDQHNGCTAVSVTVVTAQMLPPAVSAAGGVFSCSAPEVTLQASTGAAAPAFVWTGPNSFHSTLQNPAVSMAGSYILQVTDGNTGCSSTATATVIADTAPPGAAAAGDSLSCMETTATLSGSSPAPNAVFAWTGPDGFISATANTSAAAPGTYLLTVTGTNGCTSTATASVTLNPPVGAAFSTADVQCNGQQNGSATVSGTGGNGAYAYAWNTGDFTATIGSLDTGTYTVTITDGALCTATASVYITQPPVLAANATAQNMSGATTNDGSVSAVPDGGTAPYTFEWSTSDTSAAVSNLGPGAYTVTVTDAHGCTDAQSVAVVPGNCGISVNFDPAPPACSGEANGSITIALDGGTAPYTYAWSSGGTAATENNLSAGTYTVTIADASNCDFTVTAVVPEPMPLALTVDTVIDPVCAGQPEGSALVSVTGGTGSVEINWSNGQTGSSATGLESGIYTVTATDGNGCTAGLTLSVVATDQEGPVIATDTATAALGPAGNATLSVQALLLDVTDNCSVQEVIFQPAAFDCTQLGPHEVIVTATDGAGNVTVDTITVVVADDLQPSLLCPASIYRCVGDDIVQYPAPVATDNCLGNGGTFALVSGLPSGAIFPPGATTNTYTYTDADGNVGACSFEVTILSPLELALDTILPDKGGLHIGGIRITASGSLPPYTYQWFQDGNPIATTAEDPDSLGNGAYTVLVTDNTGCTETGGPFVVDSLVATHTPEWAGGLLIAPNPTNGQLQVVFRDQFPADAALSVFDGMGNLIQQMEARQPAKIIVDLSAQPNGLYTLLIRVDRQVVARKVVVHR